MCMFIFAYVSGPLIVPASNQFASDALHAHCAQVHRHTRSDVILAV